jgi:hypothetical protein
MNGKGSSRSTSMILSVARFIIVVILAIIFCQSEVMAEANGNSGDGQEKGPLSIFNDKQLEKLRAGEAVYEYKETSGEGENSAGYGQASIIIDAPIDRCFEICSNLENQVHYVPGKKKSKIVGEIDGKLLLDNEINFLMNTTRYHSLYTINKDDHRLVFELDKSRPHDIVEMLGSHHFVKIDENKTLYTYGMKKLDIGISFPGFMKKYFLGRELPAMAINVKKYIESTTASGGK